MFSKNKDNASSKAEKPIKEKPVKVPKEKASKAPKETKQPKKGKSSKVEQDLSELAKRLGIRVSSPYGYYPEDVDPIIANLEKTVSDLEIENKKLSEQLHTTQTNLSSASSELAQIKMQMSLMEVPDLSAEEEFAMLGRIDSITGQYNSESVVDMKQQLQQQPQPAPQHSSPLPKPKIKFKPKQQ